MVIGIRLPVLLVLVILLAGCAPTRFELSPRLAALPVLTLPPGVYETVIDRLLLNFDVEYAVIADDTQICPNLEHRHSPFSDHFEDLATAFQEAHRDCNQKGDEDYRIPVDGLRPGTPIRARSSLGSYEADLEHPTIFLSRPGEDPDGTVLVVAGGYYCGPVCGGSVLFIFTRQADEWVLQDHWTMFVS